jgi:uncharacterized membrane-anchored protein
MLLQGPERIPDGVIPTVRIVEVVNPPTPELSMVDVTTGAFGLTGLIMSAAVIAGLLAGALFIWYRARHAVSAIEARGGHHDFFKA